MKSPFTHDEVDTRSLQLETLYSLEKRKSFVGMMWGDQAAQVTPDEARKFAANVMECAAVAEQDEVVMDWLVNRIGADIEQAAQMLIDLRKIRDEINGRR